MSNILEYLEVNNNKSDVLQSYTIFWITDSKNFINGYISQMMDIDDDASCIVEISRIINYMIIYIYI